MFDGEAFGQQMVEIVRGYVDSATAPLLERIDAQARQIEALEQREVPVAEPLLTEEFWAAVEARSESSVKSAVAALPAPKDGEPGKDGIGLADVLRDAEGDLVVVMTDGRTKSLGQIDGKDGDHGKDGSDGITPTFLDAEFVGRTLRLTFDGERVCEFQLATPEYCGVFKDGGTYEPGDIVTWAGSAWHCDEAKGLKPGAPDSGWTLMVKAGRPGKDK